MHYEPHSLLTSLQTAIAALPPDSPAYQAADPVSGLCLLDHFGLITAQGADTDLFLQGQLTQDLRNVTPQRSALGAHCTPKGRVLGLMRLIRHDAQVLLWLPRDLIPAMMKRLRMYVLRSQVKLDDASERWLSLGLWGTAAAEALTRHFGTAPQDPDDAHCGADWGIVRIPGPTPRWLLLMTPEQAATWWGDLLNAAPLQRRGRWDALDIRAGLPWITSQTQDRHVPQQLNLHLINGVSFTKGCYTGQEIVARMQYLGTLKRRMYRAELQCLHPPEAGTALDCSASHSGQGAGSIISAAAEGAGRCEVLAIVEQEAYLANQVNVKNTEISLRFIDLPYSFPD